MKRIISLVLLMVFVFSIGVSAQVKTEIQGKDVQVSEASENKLEKVQAIVEKANTRIEKKIDKAVATSERILGKYENGKLSETEKDAKIEELIDQLITKSNEISLNARTRCEKLGYTVECEWVEVEIDGSIILVDPLIIIGE